MAPFLFPSLEQSYLPGSVNPDCGRKHHILDSALVDIQLSGEHWFSLKGMVPYLMPYLSLQNVIPLFYQAHCFRMLETGLSKFSEHGPFAAHHSLWLFPDQTQCSVWNTVKTGIV